MTSICDTCGQEFKSRGLAAHQKACRRDTIQMQEDCERQNAQAGPAACKPTFDNAEYVHPDELEGQSSYYYGGLSYDLPPALQQDDIRMEYHPHSGIPMKTDHFTDFHCHTAAPSLICENTTPWELFTSCINFDFTELVLKANLTKLQINELISLIHHSALERFSVTDYDGICKLWDAASSHHTKFKKEVILIPHRDQEHDFDVWYRPLWDWACDLLKDPCLANASGIVKYSSLPKDEGKPFAFIIYANKAKLSSFGHQKAYPVIAQCANLPVGICNGEGFSGGHLVEEDRQYSGTQSFVNFKNVMWHKSFKCLLKSLTPLSKTGFWVKCWDADYKEQPLGHRFSFDHLHFQECVKSIGWQTQSQIDVHFDSMPHWHNINHFNHVMDISFSDGLKYEDISKLIIFSAHDVIDRATHALPYLLLRCICEYVNIDMYATLEVHTSETIAVGRQAIKEFTQLLDQYSTKDDSGKNWAYPKWHAHAHLFDNIKVKGATHNTNTKPNEKCHGPIRQIYLQRTNFKNIAEQVLHLDHRFLIAHSIHLDIKDYNDLITSQNDPLCSDSEDNERPNNDSDATLHIKLGAAQKEQTFATLEQLHANDNAFNRFRIKLANFLSDSLPAHGIPLPGGK
ncbi:uncharacterized protein BJ212DRAFT_1303023 [Suillus subaureus]|uniref:Uncharacterized protein n=1 Tax=Suillus subaureus TaxID=48587 RepID=A0A9P7E0X6_9AGAM|nr:uncharacterized protein BJ212DRAFT_1303023 [Suillus subaureus]KAG1808410.1 hypothetical protein BJ212DRAFT_1303023 [Suillus subaureus]